MQLLCWLAKADTSCLIFKVAGYGSWNFASADAMSSMILCTFLHMLWVLLNKSTDHHPIVSGRKIFFGQANRFRVRESSMHTSGAVHIDPRETSSQVVDVVPSTKEKRFSYERRHR